MVYKASIPQPNDKLRISQAELLENFTKLDSVFEKDHITYSDITGDGGKHSATTFVNRTDKALPIPPTTGVKELAFYVKDDGTNIPRIFYQEPNSAGVPPPAGLEIQVSGSVKATANGESPLIGGLSLKWFTVSTGSASNTFLYTDVSLTPYTTNTFVVVASAQNRINNVALIAKPS
ncbi:MAG: hypothetical protein MUO43_06020, partial [Desulfobacterales bacterium]|nr:hypothetical protein [Desulfobacterales bacterium]